MSRRSTGPVGTRLFSPGRSSPSGSVRGFFLPTSSFPIPSGSRRWKNVWLHPSDHPVQPVSIRMFEYSTEEDDERRSDPFQNGSGHCFKLFWIFDRFFV